LGDELPRGLAGGITLDFVASTKPLIGIPPVLFKDHWVDALSEPNGNNLETRVYDPAGTNPGFYSNIHVNREQAMAWLRREARQIMNAKKAARSRRSH
jgi:hypothetical protein